jgi:hypothetical protein
MTAQISDVVVYRAKPHSVAGISGSGLFDPTEHGIKPVTISTACWRGYHCTYAVAGNTLLLIQVNIGFGEEDRALAERGEGPKLFGQVPRRYTIHGHSMDLSTGEVKTSWESDDFLYGGLREVVPFSGGMLLGADFLWGLYVNMGFHPAWKFREVHELIFERGRVVKAADRSVEMAGFRETLADRPLEPSDPENREEIERWVERCFSLKYRW